MRVIFVNRFYAPDLSATSQMLTDLATALAGRGIDVQVITSRLHSTDLATVFAPSEDLDDVLVHRVLTSRLGRDTLLRRAIDYLTFHVAASAKLFRLARQDDLIVLLTDPPLISVSCGWIARMRGARVVNWLHDIFPEIAELLGIKLARGAAGSLLRWLRNGSLHAASCNVVLGQRMRERVAALGIDPGRIALIPNWADGELLHPSDRDGNPLRDEWGLAGKFVVGYSGNMGRAHEFQTVLGAVDALRAHPDIAFVFIGGGAQRAGIAAAASVRNLRNLSFRPHRPRQLLNRSLGAIDAHVESLLERLEGLIVPSKFYGVAAVGRPTLYIGDPEGEIGAIVRDADCGYCVREGDVTGLVKAILALRDDPALGARMDRNARRLFEENFDMSIAIGKWCALLGVHAPVETTA